MKTQESFKSFKSDIDNFMELIKENLSNIKNDVKENKKNTAVTVKSILQMNAVANDIIKTNEIYFNSSVSKNINELENNLELEEFISNYLLKFKPALEKEVKEKRGITKETDESENYLKSCRFFYFCFFFLNFGQDNRGNIIFNRYFDRQYFGQY